jgi:hypothetical protein
MIALAAALLAPPLPLKVHTRADWGAKPPVLELPRHKIDRITLHHTGVRQAPDRPFFDKLRGLQAWSQRADELVGGRAKPQWADIPYHYYIDVNGEAAECRPVELPGDTNTSYDVRGHLLIVVEGSFPTDYFNIRQKRTLIRLTAMLAERHGVSANRIAGHMDFAPGETDCPGESIMQVIPEIKSAIEKQRA